MGLASPWFTLGTFAEVFFTFNAFLSLKWKNGDLYGDRKSRKTSPHGSSAIMCSLIESSGEVGLSSSPNLHSGPVKKLQLFNHVVAMMNFNSHTSAVILM